MKMPWDACMPRLCSHHLGSNTATYGHVMASEAQSQASCACHADSICRPHRYHEQAESDTTCTPQTVLMHAPCTHCLHHVHPRTRHGFITWLATSPLQVQKDRHLSRSGQGKERVPGTCSPADTSRVAGLHSLPTCAWLSGIAHSSRRLFTV